MINVRVRFTDEDGTYWTSPIRNPDALRALLVTHRERGVPSDVYDDELAAQVADLCFAGADRQRHGAARGTLEWGPGGRSRYCCDIAKEPPGVIPPIPVERFEPAAPGDRNQESGVREGGMELCSPGQGCVPLTPGPYPLPPGPQPLAVSELPPGLWLMVEWALDVCCRGVIALWESFIEWDYRTGMAKVSPEAACVARQDEQRCRER